MMPSRGFQVGSAAVLPYEESGSGEAVILLHAGVADRSMWREHLDWLAGEGYRAIAIDLPGFGEAAVSEGPQAPWEDVLRTAKDLGLERATFVGNSFGGAVALRVAAVAPAAASALALISCPPLDLDPSAQLAAAWEAENAALEREDLEGAVQAVLDAWLLPSASPELRDRLAAMQRRALELQTAAGEVTEAPDPLESHPELLGRLEIPVVAAAGEHDMPDFVQAAKQLADLMPRGESVVLEGAGHLAPLETPGAFRSFLLAFLRGQ
jgi:pimeloyl-ACP methyl ester carboxylesterase